MNVKTVSDSGNKKAVLDSYAWIEYFRGSSEGEIVKRYLENRRFQLFTPSLVIAELSDKYRREGINSWAIRKSFIKLKSSILVLDDITADKAGELKQTLRKQYKNAGLADAIILAHSIQNNAVLLTGDVHLIWMDNAVNLKNH